MALLLKHQTVERFVARVREAYREGPPEKIVRIARFIEARLQSGDLTAAQLRAAFGLNATQFSALRTRMQALIAADNTVRAAQGE
jgi:hypothetical protein